MGTGVGVGVTPGGSGAAGRVIVCVSHLPSVRQKSYWTAVIAFGVVSTRRSMLRYVPSLGSRSSYAVSACPALPSTVIFNLIPQQSDVSRSLICPRG